MTNNEDVLENNRQQSKIFNDKCSPNLTTELKEFFKALSKEDEFNIKYMVIRNPDIINSKNEVYLNFINYIIERRWGVSLYD